MRQRGGSRKGTLVEIAQGEFYSLWPFARGNRITGLRESQLEASSQRVNDITLHDGTLSFEQHQDFLGKI